MCLFIIMLLTWAVRLELINFLIKFKVTGQGFECIFSFTSQASKSGNFSSPNWPLNYSNSQTCVFNFEGEPFETINITFISFHLEEPFEKGCLADYIDIMSISSFNMKRLIGRFCGAKVPPSFLSMHSKLQMIFQTDHTNNFNGFYGMYQFLNENTLGKVSLNDDKHCGGYVTGAGGVIVSPNYPLMFPRQADCKWLIRVRQDQHIYLRLIELQLFGNIANCKDAQLTLHDGYDSLGPITYDFTKQYCGDLNYYKSFEDKVELSATNRVIVKFISDIKESRWNEFESQQVIGFKLIWTAISFKAKDNCDQFLCQSSEFCLNPRVNRSCHQTYFFCIDRSLLCNHIPNCSELDESDEIGCLLYTIGIPGLCGLGLCLLLLFTWLACMCSQLRRRVVKKKKLKQSMNQLFCQSL